VAALTALLYAVTMPIAFPTEDAATQLAMVEQGDWQWEPGHILALPLLHAVHFAADSFGFGSQWFILVQVLNIILALASMLLLWNIFKLVRIEPPVAVVAVALFGFCHGVWLHGTTAATGIHSQFFLIIAVYFMLRYLMTGTGNFFHALIAVASFSVAVLFAIQLGLLAPVFVIPLLWARRDTTPEFTIRLLRTFIAALAMVALIAGPIFAAAASQGSFGIEGTVKWVTSHPEDQLLSHLQPLSFEQLIRPAAGFIALFADTENALTTVKLALRGAEVQGIAMPMYFTLAAAAGIGLLIVIAMLVGVWRSFSKTSTRFAVVCLILLYAFYAYWLGSDPQFWLPALPFILILVGEGLSGFLASRKTSNWRVYGLVSATALALIVFNIPQSSPSILFQSGGKDYATAMKFNAQAQTRDMLITPGWNWTDMTLHTRPDLDRLDLVYSPRLDSGAAFLSTIDSLIDSRLVENKSVFIDGVSGLPTVQQYGAWEMVQSGRGISRNELVQHLRDRYELVTLEISPDIELVKIVPPPPIALETPVETTPEAVQEATATE
jgi:hypothetical protein